jgi:hypothetical protein
MMESMRKNWQALSFIVLCLAYVIITASALFVQSHFFYNLEPYPDGLLYTVAARNLAIGNGLTFAWEQGTVPVWTPPLYALVLAPLYLFTDEISLFYLVNIGLGLLCIYFLYKAAKKLSQDRLVPLLVVVTYLGHGYVLLLPSLPLSENLSLTLTAAVLYFVAGKPQPKQYLLALVSGIGLVLSRYAALFTTVFVVSYLFIELWVLKYRRMLVFSIGLALVSALMLGLFLSAADQQPWTLITFFVRESLQGGFYYNPANLIPNTIFYSGALLGQPARFLWYLEPLTSPVVSILFALASWDFIKSKKNFRLGLFSLGFLFSQLVLLLGFHASDSRYLVTVLPLFSLLVPYFILFDRKMYKAKLLLIALMLLSLAVSQRDLYKQVLVANILGRTEAWQYQAIKSFDVFFEDKPSATLVTALPPYLVDVYRKTQYEVAPLSQSQEFIHKKQYIWGPDIEYTDLVAGYKKSLTAGKKLYVSNAYITHSHLVVTDFERFKVEFNLKEVTTGCDNACNLYELTLK